MKVEQELSKYRERESAFQAKKKKKGRNKDNENEAGTPQGRARDLFAANYCG